MVFEFAKVDIGAAPPNQHPKTQNSNNQSQYHEDFEVERFGPPYLDVLINRIDAFVIFCDGRCLKADLLQIVYIAGSCDLEQDIMLSDARFIDSRTAHHGRNNFIPSCQEVVLVAAHKELIFQYQLIKKFIIVDGHFSLLRN